MKKALAILLALTLCLGMFAACGAKENEKKGYDYDAIPNQMTSSDGKYEIAFVTDVGQLMDKSFNQGTFEGVKRYAKENNKSYKYYQPANGADATDNYRIASMRQAVKIGAKIIVAPGFLQAGAMETVAKENPDVKFVFVVTI